MTTNPNPARITDASWRYVEARLALDAGDAVYAGSYVNKPGYHGTRAENHARDAIDGSKDYSVRLPQDLRGPADKTAGYDIKFRSAAAGNFAPMARRGGYVLAAFDARDPRLFGWREWLGQTDPDRPAEGLDFTTWTKRVPDDTHEWHDHESELREFVESWDNKACMLSIIAGESLSAYLARGGRLLPGASLPPGFTIEEDDMIGFAKDPATGQIRKSSGGITFPTTQREIDDIRSLAAQGVLGPVSSKVHPNLAYVYAFGYPVELLINDIAKRVIELLPASGTGVTEEQVRKLIAHTSLTPPAAG